MFSGCHTRPPMLRGGGSVARGAPGRQPIGLRRERTPGAHRAHELLVVAGEQRLDHLDG